MEMMAALVHLQKMRLSRINCGDDDDEYEGDMSFYATTYLQSVEERLENSAILHGL